MSYVNDIGNTLPYETDEVTHYIFHNYFGLMTEAEKMAYTALINEWKGGNSSSENMKRQLRFRFGASEPGVVALLNQGAGQFLIATGNRILSDHASEVFLNRCPKCNALARTPEACLCPSCGHTWYEKRSG